MCNKLASLGFRYQVLKSNRLETVSLLNIINAYLVLYYTRIDYF